MERPYISSGPYKEKGKRRANMKVRRVVALLEGSRTPPVGTQDPCELPCFILECGCSDARYALSVETPFKACVLYVTKQTPEGALGRDHPSLASPSASQAQCVAAGPPLPSPPSTTLLPHPVPVPITCGHRHMAAFRTPRSLTRRTCSAQHGNDEGMLLRALLPGAQRTSTLSSVPGCWVCSEGQRRVPT